MSKYLAERFAWDFIETKAKGAMELAVINPVRCRNLSVVSAGVCLYYFD